MLSPTLDSQRLQFDVAQGELWGSWCALQTPILDDTNPAGLYSCAHNWGFSSNGTTCAQTDPMTMQTITVSCAKLELCGFGNGVCSCTKASCVGNVSASNHFDMVVAPPKADGSVSALQGGVNNVHFTKQ
ncbi:MAG: hypothetical protein ABJB12_17230 [Pseudomonadota bacterium]